MASELIQAIRDVLTREATEAKNIRTDYNGKIGTLSSLTTTEKTNLVLAINEIVGSIGEAGATINDATTATTSVWSSDKTSTEISDAAADVKSEILGGAGTAYDTLQELKALLDASDSADDAAITAINTALGNRLRVDAAQGLTSGQKLQARDNIDVYSKAEIGDISAVDFVADYEAALL